MNRITIKTILEKHHYSDESIKKIFQLKMRPILLKAIKMQEEDNIPVTIWKDKETLKSFITDNSSSNQSTNSTT